MNEKEKKSVSAMISIYCKSKHGQNYLCDDCRELEDYAHNRLEKCTYGEDKPTCEHCSIHCYKKDKREQIRMVMRYAGPRMLFKHPVMAIKHLLKNKKG